MKTHSDELFSLIRAMSPVEKQFFKTFSVKNHQSDSDLGYITLFDALNNMKQYDEPLLQEKLRKAGFAYNLNKAKNYLTKAILKIMAEYHAGSSVKAQIQNMIFQAEILYEKRMKNMADKILLKAENLALEYECYEHLLLISSVKSGTALEPDDMDAMKKNLLADKPREKQYLELLKNTIDYKNLFIEYNAFAQSPEVKSDNEARNKKIKNLFNNPMLKNSKSAITFSAKEYFYLLNYGRFLNENLWNEQSCKVMNEWVEYLEKKGAMLMNVSETYLMALSRLVATFKYTRKEKEAQRTYEKAKKFYLSLPNKYRKKSVQWAFIHVTMNYTAMHLYLFNPEKCIRAYTELSRHVTSNLLNNKSNLVLFFSLSCSYFLLGNYREALLFVNKLLNVKSDYRTDVQALARVYALIVHYELKHEESLPYLSKSSERWLEKNNYPLKNFDKTLLDFFKHRLQNINSAEEKTRELENLLSQVKKIQNKEYSILKNEFDLISWLESKIENRPFAEVVKEKATK